MQTYLLESKSQQQGEAVKSCMRELQRSISKLQREYTHTGAELLKSECKKTEEAINILKNLKPESKREQLERQALVETYSRQFSRLLESMHKYNESKTQIETPQQLQTLQAQVYEDDILKDRHIELIQIEECLVEVNNIMKYCAETVQEQGHVLDRIETHVDSSVEDSHKSVLELNKAEKYQISSQGLCRKMMIFVAIAVILVILYYTY